MKTILTVQRSQPSVWATPSLVHSGGEPFCFDLAPPCLTSSLIISPPQPKYPPHQLSFEHADRLSQGFHPPPFFLIALLKHGSHTIQSVCFKCMMYGLYFHRGGCSSSQSILEHFYHSRKKCYIVQSLLPVPLQPWAATNLFLSVWFCLFRTFHIDGIIYYVLGICFFFFFHSA